MDNLNTHNVWAVKIFITEIIYFLNVLLNLYFIDVFLGELADQHDPQRNVNSINTSNFRWRVSEVRFRGRLDDGGQPRGPRGPDGEDLPQGDH